MKARTLKWTVALLALVALAVTGGGANAQRNAQQKKKPNIVFVLTDDLASNLVQYMPHVKKLEAQGVTFVTDLIDSGVCHQAIFLDPAGNSLNIHHRYAA